MSTSLRLTSRGIAALAVIGAALGCGGEPRRDRAPEALTPIEQLGQQLFDDQGLSASGAQSCATCHDAAHAFSNPEGEAVQRGGPNMDLPGLRNTPSILYASFAPPFSFDEEGAPVGGQFRDGRADTLADQAVLPLVTPFEMANADNAEVLARLRGRPYVAEFEEVFGAGILDHADQAVAALGRAIAAFEQTSRFHPFSSKFDAFQRGEVALSPRELEGLTIFNSHDRGNCAACHPSTSADGANPALFTDFSYDNLGVPRNEGLAANDDASPLPYALANAADGVHHYYDLGLCGPVRGSPVQDPSLCGAFKVPSLRNVALTAPYFHNGVFPTLQETVGFYVRRNTDPAEWYPAGPDGAVIEFDDLPAAYGGQFAVQLGALGSDLDHAGNVNTAEVPYDRHLGEAPRLNADELQSLVAFLCTLTDGFDPLHPEQYRWPTQCEAAEPLSLASSTR